MCSHMWDGSLRQRFEIKGVFYKVQDNSYKRTLRALEGEWWANDSEFYSTEQLEAMMAWAQGHGIMLGRYGVSYDDRVLHPVVALTTHGENTTRLMFNAGVDQVVMRVYRALDGSVTMRDPTNRDIVESVALGNLLYSMVMEAKLARLGRLYYISGVPRLRSGISFTRFTSNRVYGSLGRMVSDLTALAAAEQEMASAVMVKNKVEIVMVERGDLMTRRDGVWVSDKMGAIGREDVERLGEDPSIEASWRHNILTPDGVMARRVNRFAKEADLGEGGKIFSEELSFRYGIDIKAKSWEELAGMLGTNSASVRRVAKKNGSYKTFRKCV